MKVASALEGLRGDSPVSQAFPGYPFRGALGMKRLKWAPQTLAHVYLDRKRKKGEGVKINPSTGRNRKKG